ncbi:MAG: DUF1194 domain-containing protein [Alphaproteobacteria bacterium]
MRAFLFGGAVALIAASPPAAGTGMKVDLELALGIDISRSVDAEEAQLQRRGYIDAFRHPSVIGAIRHGPFGRIAVSYYEWSGLTDINLVADWTLIHDKATANAFADALARDTPAVGRRTGIANGINYGVDSLDDNAFAARRRVIDISGDGPNNHGELVTFARDRAVARRITINGLPIMNDKPSPSGRPPLKNLDLYYRDCVIGGPGAFYVVANDFKDFARAVLRKLIIEIADLAPARRAPRKLLIRAAVRARRAAPPCDIGETLRQQWWDNYDNDDDNWVPGPFRSP